MLHLSAQYIIVDVLGVFVAVVWLGAIPIYIMYKHGAHALEVDVFLALGEIVFYGFLLQHHSGDVGNGEIDGVAFHDMFALDGGQHSVCPAQFALALVFDGSGADEFYVGG